MSFFKKLFGNNKSEDKIPKEIFTEEYFNNRYTEENMKDNLEMFEGHFKLVTGYFIDMKIDQPIEDPINHPQNLDSMFDQLIDFKDYCNGFQLDDKMVAFTLSTVFSDFLINKYGFKLYKDQSPEYSLRFLTLKYSKNGVVLSLYPYEYSVKVMNLEAKFDDLENRIKDKLEIMPEYREAIDKIINRKE